MKTTALSLSSRHDDDDAAAVPYRCGPTRVRPLAHYQHLHPSPPQPIVASTRTRHGDFPPFTFSARSRTRAPRACAKDAEEFSAGEVSRTSAAAAATTKGRERARRQDNDVPRCCGQVMTIIIVIILLFCRGGPRARKIAQLIVRRSPFTVLLTLRPYARVLFTCCTHRTLSASLRTL